MRCSLKWRRESQSLLEAVRNEYLYMQGFGGDQVVTEDLRDMARKLQEECTKVGNEIDRITMNNRRGDNRAAD